LLAAGFNPLRLKETKKTDKFEPIIRIDTSILDTRAGEARNTRAAAGGDTYYL
jgi:hypothetical protein